MKTNELHNVADIISLQAKNIPDAIAVYLLNQKFSYKELDALVWKTATYFHKNNIKGQSVAGLIFDDEFTLLVAMLACARIGVTVFSISKNDPLTYTNNLKDKLGIKYMLTDVYDESAEDSTLVVNLDDIDKKSIDIDFSIEGNFENTPWVFITGSGTTGKSKIIPVSHKQQIERVKLGKEWIPRESKDVFFSFINLEFYGCKLRYLERFFIGSSIVIERKVENFKRLVSFNITSMYATVFHIETIFKNKNIHFKNILSKLDSMLIGGSPVSKNLREKIYDHLCKKLFILYGTNETSTSTIHHYKKGEKFQNTVGKPFRSIKIEVVDRDGKQKPLNVIGHIRIKSPGVVDAYRNDEKATKKSFKDGWFYPGDIGQLTEDGELIYLGRADHMLIMNGINIYPTEIEQILTMHPDVEEAVVMPLKSSRHQDIPISAVVLSQKSKMSEKELLDYTYQSLGARAPKRVLVLDIIPRNEQGKIIRKKLLDYMNSKLNTGKKKRPMSGKNSIDKYRQTRRTTSIQLKKKIPSSLQNIDKWLLAVLEITPNPSTSRPIIDIVHRALLLHMTLMQSIRIPIFDHGDILNIDSKDKETYNISISFAYIDHIPEKVYFRSIQFSLRIILNFFHRDITSKNIQLLYKTLKKEFIGPMSKVSGSGKSTMPILTEAYRANIPFMHLQNGIYQLGWGSKAKRISRSATQYDSAIGSALSHNKIIASSLIRSAGLPAPEHMVAVTKEEAVSASNYLGWPLVVKPSDQDRGEGVTVDVVDEKLLFEAFDVAHKLSKSKRVIVEKQVDGVCCRVFIANDKMLYGVNRLPKGVRGDGIHSVKELIKKENAREERLPPWKKTEFFPLDDMAIKSMSDAGFTLDSIPQKDILVPLRRIESTQWGGVDEDISEVIHNDNVELARKAARLFGLSVAGIDIITSDISIPWHQSDAIVNEVNFSPQYGGGEISRLSIPAYLSDLMEEDGRIPITIIVGDNEAMKRAKSIQEKQFKDGIRSFVSSHNETFLPEGKGLDFLFEGLNQRCKALLLDSNVDALILVVQTDEFLQSELPIDKIDDFILIKEELDIYSESQKKMLMKRLESLRQ